MPLYNDIIEVYDQRISKPSYNKYGNLTSSVRCLFITFPSHENFAQSPKIGKECFGSDAFLFPFKYISATSLMARLACKIGGMHQSILVLEAKYRERDTYLI